MTNTSFKRAILYARKHRVDQGVNETLERLVIFLKKQDVETTLDPETATCFNLKLPIIHPKQMNKKTDFIIVVGGDGSLLSAAKMAVPYDIPVTGISRGRLGFLTDISPNELEKQLGDILNGQFREEKRYFLQTTIHDEEQTYFQGIALNDVVLSRGNETHLIEFDVSIDEQFVSHYRSDGLILATPTGSTAYSLSAGGPIMHPELDAFVMVPMFSHSLSTRPLVFAGSSQISIDISLNNEHNLRVSCDSQESKFIKPGQRISIKKHQPCVRLLHPLEYNYYDTLRLKLGWGFKPQG